MHLSRFRLRTLLIAIAIIALMLWGQMMWRMSSRYRNSAGEHAGWVQFYKDDIREWERLAVEQEREAEGLYEEANKIQPPGDPMYWSNDKEANLQRLKELRSQLGIEGSHLILLSIKSHGLRVEADDASVAANRYRSRIADLQKKVEYHSDLEKKYRRAALNPWLPVAPDPPEPE